MIVRTLCGVVVASAMLSSAAIAADHQVQMLNKDSSGRAMQFEPAFLKIEPGDTVTFIATDKAHNSESIPAGIPDAAEGWKGKINEEIAVTFETEGLYAYKCTPHLGLGMVGLIQVGDDASNLDAVQAVKLPPKARTVMTELIAKVEQPTN